MANIDFNRNHYTIGVHYTDGRRNYRTVEASFDQAVEMAERQLGESRYIERIYVNDRGIVAKVIS